MLRLDRLEHLLQMLRLDLDLDHPRSMIKLRHHPLLGVQPDDEPVSLTDAPSVNFSVFSLMILET